MRSLIEPDHSLDEILQMLRFEFNKASSLKRHPFKYVVLSTSTGAIINSRYVVLRKFTDNDRFLIFTDNRSEKISDLKLNDNCNLLFYHNGKRLQVRVNGKAIIHQNNTLTQRYWHGVKGKSDKAYTSILPPGKKIEKPEDAYVWDEHANSLYFTVLEIIPTQIEALQLNRDQHIRAQYIINDGDVEATFLAP